MDFFAYSSIAFINSSSAPASTMTQSIKFLPGEQRSRRTSLLGQIAVTGYLQGIRPRQAIDPDNPNPITRRAGLGEVTRSTSAFAPPVHWQALRLTQRASRWPQRARARPQLAPGAEIRVGYRHLGRSSEGSD